MMVQLIWHTGLLLLSFDTYDEDSGVLPGLAVMVTAFWGLAVRFHRGFVVRGRILSKISGLMRVSWELFSNHRLDERLYRLQILECAHALGHGLGDHESTLAPDHVHASSQAPTVPESARRSYATS